MSSDLTLQGGRLTDDETRSRRESIIAFMHIPKTAGTTVSTLLQRHFGLRHLDVLPIRGAVYTPEQLAADLRLLPYRRVQSIGGHWCRPFVDYDQIGKHLDWYTFLRNPIKRYVSHFQHGVEKMGMTQSFDEYLDEPVWRNWQVQAIAGREDIDLAKQILAEKFRFVGLTERFSESLLLMRERLWLKEMNIHCRDLNREKTGQVRMDIERDFAKWESRVVANNLLDIELYEYAAETIYPRQLEEYGRAKLDADLKGATSVTKVALSDLAKKKLTVGMWAFFYQPVVLARSKSGRWRT